MKKALELLETRIWLTREELEIEGNNDEWRGLNYKLERLIKLRIKLKARK